MRDESAILATGVHCQWPHVRQHTTTFTSLSRTCGPLSSYRNEKQEVDQTGHRINAWFRYSQNSYSSQFKSLHCGLLRRSNDIHWKRLNKLLVKTSDLKMTRRHMHLMQPVKREVIISWVSIWCPPPPPLNVYQSCMHRIVLYWWTLLAHLKTPHYKRSWRGMRTWRCKWWTCSSLYGLKFLSPTSNNRQCIPWAGQCIWKQSGYTHTHSEDNSSRKKYLCTNCTGMHI